MLGNSSREETSRASGSHLTKAQETGGGVNATWLYTLGSIVFVFVVFEAVLILDVAQRYAGSGSALDLVLLLAVLTAGIAQVRWCWYLREERLPSAPWIVALVAPAVVAWGIAFARPEMSVIAAVPLWLAASLIACFFASRSRWTLLALAAVVIAVPILSPWPAGIAQTSASNRLVMAYAAFMPIMLFSSLWFWRVVARLDESRRVAAELAVTQERLRFASDLHDIQGHHLQVIALKGELAERLMERDPAAAAAQVHEIRVIAKDALEETRALVAGLREVALADELENAREVLTLTGATCELRAADVPVDPQLNRALAFSVREATTNILRHSEATSAAIVLRCTRTSWELTVTNNGAGSGREETATLASQTAGEAPASGTGLLGLRGRVEALGGTLSATLRADEFELRVALPHTPSGEKLLPAPQAKSTIEAPEGTA